MKDLMIDLETMSNMHDAAIVQIGALYFDRETGEIGDSFQANVDLDSSLAAGMNVTGDTIMWWFKQVDEARKSISGKAKDLNTSLKKLAEFIKPDSIIWCHATFDGPILANNYKRLGIKLPFHYGNVRDLRTLVDLADLDLSSYKAVGTKHTADADCRYQIKYAVDAISILKGRK